MQNFIHRYQFQLLVLDFQSSKDNFSDVIEKLIKGLNRQSLEILLDLSTKDKSIMVSIKWLILMHFISLQGSAKNIDLRSKILNELKVDVSGLSSFQQVLYEKLFVPYKLYIQKRNVFSIMKENEQFAVYQIMNIIRQALSFTNVLYMVGRYVVSEHTFLRFFAILIAKDLRYLYKILINRLTQKICMQNAEILQKINEGLYNIYYNCYFCKYVSCYAPVWLNTETIFKQIEDIKKSEKKSEKKSVEGNRPKTQKLLRTWRLIQDRQTQKSMILENFSEKDQIETLSLEEIPEDCDQEYKFIPKQKILSISTIESKEALKQQIKQSAQMQSRRQFIAMASNILQQIQTIENTSRLL